jgi:branched-chain amino acid transport system permease protein
MTQLTRPLQAASASAASRFARLPAPARGRGAKTALAVVLLLLVIWFGASGNIAWVYEADAALLAAIGALGLNLLTGNVGQISIGNAAFLAIGAYAVVICDGDVPFPVPIVVGTLACGVAGFLIGLPSLRLRGLYLVFSTLAFQYVVNFLFEQYDSSHGAGAGHYVPSPTIFGMQLSNSRSWYMLLLVVVAIVMIIVRNLVRGRPGRAWSAIRTNELAAAVMGVNVTRAKLAGFVASSMIVGFAGALSAYFLQTVSADYFSLDLAVTYIAMILIGGLGSVWGSVIGAFIVTLIPYWLSGVGGGSSPTWQADLPFVQQIVYGLAILLFLYLRPGGVASLVRPRHRSAASEQVLEDAP